MLRDLIEGPGLPTVESEPQAQNLPLTGIKRFEHSGNLLRKTAWVIIRHPWFHEGQLRTAARLPTRGAHPGDHSCKGRYAPPNMTGQAPHACSLPDGLLSDGDPFGVMPGSAWIARPS